MGVDVFVPVPGAVAVRPKLIVTFPKTGEPRG